MIRESQAEKKEMTRFARRELDEFRAGGRGTCGDTGGAGSHRPRNGEGGTSPANSAANAKARQGEVTREPAAEPETLQK